MVIQKKKITCLHTRDAIECACSLIFVHAIITLATTEGDIHLNSKTTLEAVRKEDDCNPIVRSVTSSYLTVAQRYVYIHMSYILKVSDIM